MKKLLWNMGKAAIAGVMLGVALSYALPALATWAGLDVATTVGAMAGAKWMALFAGAFSVASVAAHGLVNAVFKDSPSGFLSSSVAEKPARETFPELAQSKGIFCNRIETERAAAQIGPNVRGA